MSRLFELITNLCPDGVEYKSLGEIATDFFRGSGIKRDQVTSDGVPCVRYGEIYSTYGIWFEKCKSHTTKEFVSKGAQFDCGDILFATTGESVEDIAKCCAYIGKETGFAGGDVAVMKHSQDPRYLAYALSTKEAQRQKSRGRIKSKVVHTSIPLLKKIVVPIPPLDVQREIVRLLDDYANEASNLINELDAELAARRKQYEQYKERLLTFGDGVERKTLGEIGEFYSGLCGKSKIDFENGTAKYISYMNVYSNIAVRTDVDDRVKISDDEQQNAIQQGDVLFTGSSETPEECAMSSVVEKRIEEPIYLNSFCFGLRLFDKSLCLPGFLKYVFRSDEARRQLNKTANGVTRFNVSRQKMARVSIPIPPLSEQWRIVKILDKFDALCNGEMAEIAAEIVARKKQCEYYREKLLSFKKKPN